MPKCGFNNVALENELKLRLYQVRFFFQDINNEILGETKLIFRQVNLTGKTVKK